LIWGLVSGKNGDAIKVFFLVCLIIAGIFGAVTLKWTTLLIKTAPGAIAIFVVWISRWKDSGSQRTRQLTNEQPPSSPHQITGYEGEECDRHLSLF
jgi:nitrate reductase cytochrome c-type subunit